VDQPLKIARDKETGKDYLLCDYNRDGDSYRSPWSNKYDPPLSDGAVPSDRLRRLEIEANQAFDTYRELYFESGVCSVYLWDLDHGFAGVILIKKAGDTEKIKGCWDSIHVVEVQVCPVGRPIGHPDSRASFVTGKGAGSKRPLQTDVDSDAVAPDDQG
jgi:capping protein beta